MKIKGKLYPKTKRIGADDSAVIVTEKVDGSNLGFFKFEGKLFIAKRNWIMPADEIDKDFGIKGLRGWLDEFGAELEASLMEGACVFGEWLGMGKLDYKDAFGERWLQFAKSNVDPVYVDGKLVHFNLKNLYYDRELFKYSFVDQSKPSFLGTVPLIATLDRVPTVEELDLQYGYYVADVERTVEGFIIISNNAIKKYVRMKNGTLTPHKA